MISRDPYPTGITSHVSSLASSRPRRATVAELLEDALAAVDSGDVARAVDHLDRAWPDEQQLDAEPPDSADALDKLVHREELPAEVRAAAWDALARRAGLTGDLAAEHAAATRANEVVASAGRVARLATLAARRGDDEDAFRLLTAGLEQWPGDVALSTTAASFALDAGESEVAGSLVASVRQRAKPDDPRIALLDARAAILDGRFEDALVVARSLVPADPSLGRALVAVALDRAERSGEDPGVIDAVVADPPSDIWLLTSFGQALIRQDRFEDAVKILERALRRWPVASDALRALGVAQAILGQYEPAAATFDAAAERSNDSWLVSMRGEVARHRDDNAVAIALLSSVPADEAMPWVASSLAAVLAGAGEIEQARSTYEGALQRNPDDVTALCGLGELWLSEVDSLERAEKLFERAVELEPANVRAMALLAESQRRQRRFDKAIAGFDVVLSISPEYSWARGSRGQARLGAGDVAGGLDDLLEALRQSPTTGWMLDVFVEALDEHRPARAESELRRLQRELRDSGCPPAALVPIYIRRAQLAAAREHWHDADELYGLARTDLPKDIPLAKEHIDVLRQLHREEDALDVLAQLAPPDDDEDLRYLRYELLWALDRLSDVRIELEARVDPDDPTSFEAAGLGEIYRVEGRREESRRYLEKALAKEPDDAYSLLSLAALDLEEDQWDRCRSLATKVLEATPDHAHALGLLMSLELTVGDEAAVRKLLDQTADIDDGPVVQTRAMGLYGLGEYVAAFRLLDDRRTERGDDPESLRFRGWVELALGQSRQAATSFRDAAVMDHSATGILDSVETLTRVGAWTDALQAIERARQLNNSYAEASMARFWLEIGDGDAAVGAAQAGVAAAPSSIEAHIVLSRALRCVGRAEESVEPARRARALSLADPVIISNLGEALFVAGERDEAQALFADALGRHARRISLDADDIAAGAWWQLRLGQPELSGEAFLRALSRTDRRASVLMGLLLANLVLGTARQVEVLIGRADEELVTLDPLTRRGVLALFLHDLSTVRAELGREVNDIAQRLDDRLRADVQRLGAEVDKALRESGADPQSTEGWTLPTA